MIFFNKSSHLKKYFLVALLCTTIGLFGFKKIAQNNEFELVKNMELFTNILKELNGYYVDEIDFDKLVTAGIDSMLQSLDPYTNYISETDIANYRQQTTGKYGGVGALIRKRDDYVVIAEPYEGFPAYEADLRAGDKILSIDGVDAKGFTTGQVSDRLKGAPNTDVSIMVERLGEKQALKKVLTRREVKVNSVPYAGMIDNNTGYIRLTSFTEGSSDEVEAALKSLMQTEATQTLASVILDLRGNPGGLLSEAVNVANVFIPSGKEVVSTSGRDISNRRIYRTKSNPVNTDIPIVVIIDNNSASASEIVSGVLQDYDRAVVIGSPSFGKGLVQSTMDVGFNNRLKLTTAKYYLPSGRGIQAIDYSGGYRPGLKKTSAENQHEFITEQGRTVYDAGGIYPDVSIAQPNISDYSLTLIRENVIFDYANLYRSKFERLPGPDEYEMTDQEFKDFMEYLNAQEYNFETPANILIAQIEEQAAKEGYTDAIKSDIDQLKKQLALDKNADLNRYEKEIRQLLEYEIVNRYYYQKGQIAEALEDDPTIEKANELLDNPNEYRSLLNQP